MSDLSDLGLEVISKPAKPNPKSTPKEIVGSHGHRPHGKSILWPALYEHLRRKGYKKSKAARISNAAWHKKRMGLPTNTPTSVRGVAKRDVSTEERKKLSEKGKALSDGSYPIANLSDLSNAIQAWGRTNESKRARVKRHLLKRAKALGAGEETIDRIKRLGSSETSKENPLDSFVGLSKAQTRSSKSASIRRGYQTDAMGNRKWVVNVHNDEEYEFDSFEAAQEFAQSRGLSKEAVEEVDTNPFDDFFGINKHGSKGTPGYKLLHPGTGKAKKVLRAARGSRKGGGRTRRSGGELPTTRGAWREHPERKKMLKDMRSAVSNNKAPKGYKVNVDGFNDIEVRDTGGRLKVTVNASPRAGKSPAYTVRGMRGISGKNRAFKSADRAVGYAFEIVGS